MSAFIFDSKSTPGLILIISLQLVFYCSIDKSYNAQMVFTFCWFCHSLPITACRPSLMSSRYGA